MSAFTEWTAEEYVVRYSLDSDESQGAFYARYTGSLGNKVLLRVLEVAKDSGSRSCLVETRYIDADWRSEHARFYSTTYSRYPSVAHRAHFFACDLPDDLDDLSGLSGYYKGYCVLRPLQSQPVGRTMLEPPTELADAVRCESMETVDVLGWRMTVRGMPFISQDAQYLRCAHADIWMTLRHSYLQHQLSRKLPGDVHDAAMGGAVAGRQIPSDGLTQEQMLVAMTTLGLSPAVLPLSEDEDADAENQAIGLGLFQIVCRYVNSNIAPIINSRNHVWLIVAYRRTPRVGESASKVVLYKHDDSAGPYIEVSNPWEEVVDEAEMCHGADLYATSDAVPIEVPIARIWAGVTIPLSPKIYMPAEDAETVARIYIKQRIGETRPGDLMHDAFSRDDLAFFTYGIDSSRYKWGLSTRLGFDGSVARRYRQTPWPRNLWVVEVVDRKLRDSNQNSVLGEVIVDPTASRFASGEEPGILAFHVPGLLGLMQPDSSEEETVLLDSDLGPYATGRPDLSQ